MSYEISNFDIVLSLPLSVLGGKKNVSHKTLTYIWIWTQSLFLCFSTPHPLFWLCKSWDSLTNCFLSDADTHQTPIATNPGQVLSRKIITENKKHCPDPVKHCLGHDLPAFPSLLYCVTTHSIPHKIIIILLPSRLSVKDVVNGQAQLSFHQWDIYVGDYAGDKHRICYRATSRNIAKYL